jgi:integrase
MRYVTVRRDAKGRERFYWQRRGFPLTRLPDPAGARWNEAQRLNDLADKAGASPVLDANISALIDKVRASEKFTSKASGTRRHYEAWCKWFGEKWGHLPITAITRRVVVDFAESWKHSPSQRGIALTVLRRIFDVAAYHGFVEANPCHRLGLSKPKSRDQYFMPADEDAFLKACKIDRLATAFHLLLFTGQRPSDCLAMPRTHYNHDTIRARQQKTKKLVEIPAHARLKAHLSTVPKASTLLAGYLGGPKSRYDAFNRDWRETVKAAGLGHLQARDLRRTAVVRMGEAGATEAEISAITGHSIERTRQILETYLVRTLPMGRSAIAKWERKGKKV